MSRRVTIVDYGVGNLRSVARALERCGATPDFATTPEEASAADALILPGVGAFAGCVAALRSRNLDEAVKRVIDAGRPVLGICVGMQMLHDESAEFGGGSGFGLIAGTVESIPATAADGSRHKIPNVGWSGLEPAGNTWTGTLLENVKPGEACYFVHSFAAMPSNAANRLAEYRYNGHPICAAVRRGNLYGLQFHPEKSGPVGLRILASFVERVGTP